VAQLIKESLELGIDYDRIPGTEKEVLLKPGAERLNMAFGTYAEFEILEKEVDHFVETKWATKWKSGTAQGLYRYVIKCRIMREGRVLANCIGSCSSLETKYANRPRDCENTVLKMAEKRAYVGATLLALALSNRFTHDKDDIRENERAYDDPRDIDPGPPPPPPREPEPERPAEGYNGSPRHKKALFGRLMADKIDESLWESIERAMMGKSILDLGDVVAGVMRDA